MQLINAAIVKCPQCNDTSSQVCFISHLSSGDIGSARCTICNIVYDVFKDGDNKPVQPKLAGQADRNVPDSNHSCLDNRCTIQTCEVWKRYALEIGRVTEVGDGKYQSEVDVAWHAFDIPAMRLVSQILAEGLKTYGRDAWRARTPEHHINHAIEHLFTALERGHSDGEPHLGNAICRVMFALGVYLNTQDILKAQTDAAEQSKGN